MKNIVCERRKIDFDDKWQAVRYLLLNESKRSNSSEAINDLFKIL